MATPQSDLKDLTQLGRKVQPSKQLEAFPNHDPQRFYRLLLSP